MYIIMFTGQNPGTKLNILFVSRFLNRIFNFGLNTIMFLGQNPQTKLYTVILVDMVNLDLINMSIRQKPKTNLLSKMHTIMFLG